MLRRAKLLPAMWCLAVSVLSLYLVCPKSSDQTDALTYAQEQKIESADIVIYGGTSGGIIAAVAAAREKRKVVILEPSGHLGGMTTGGLGNTDVGNPGAIGGYSREFYQRVFDYY
ncbi:MAG: FAD-dependent oxidoreductase, partial [Gemmatales bacterium]|nr:FAD-dependent oxidoreductase [Gemmatales bacterium]MDW8174736.1 FAD-dependent oxidoreductase [Gemmatales bacterium]